jgi:lysophospholipase L1-like esterase
LENLIQTAQKNKVPLLLGEIPVFMSQMQPSAKTLNEKIKSYCAAYENCYVLPLQNLLVKTLTDGFIVYQGKKITIENLLPDGLHIAMPASEFLADRIAEVLEKPRS